MHFVTLHKKTCCIEIIWRHAIFILAFPKMSPLLYKHCQQGVQYSLSFPKGSPVPIRRWPKGLQQPLGASPACLNLNRPFLFISFKYNFQIYIYKNIFLKIRAIVKTIRSSLHQLLCRYIPQRVST